MVNDDKKTTDQVVDEEDDFDFGKTEGSEDGEGSEEGSKEGSKEDKKEEAGNKDGETDDDNNKSRDEEDSGDSSGEDDGGEEEGKEDADDATVAESDKSVKGSEGKEGKREEEGKGEPDFFGEEFSEAGESGEEKIIDLKPIAEGFGIKLEKGTTEEFRQKVNEKIEASKQEFKIDDYPADAQAIIKHLKENDGKIEDFFNNPTIVSLQSVIGLSPEQKVLYIRANELTNAGIEVEKAREQAEAEVDEWSTKEIKNRADLIDTDAKKLISEEIGKVVVNREEIVSKQTEKRKSEVVKEKENLKTYVNSQEEFMGLKLTPKAKQNIVQAIESGEFDSVTDKTPEASKFRAYMLEKFGKKIAENYSNTASEQNRKGHNEAVDKSTGALHKTKASAQKSTVGHQKTEGSGDKKNFETWTDDLFENVE